MIATLFVAAQQADERAAASVAAQVCAALQAGPNAVSELPLRGLGQQARDHLAYLATLEQRYRCSTGPSAYPDSWSERAVEVRTADATLAIALRVSYDLMARSPSVLGYWGAVDPRR